MHGNATCGGDHLVVYTDVKLEWYTSKPFMGFPCGSFSFKSISKI